MRPYHDRSGGGVTHFFHTPDSIKVWFQNGSAYTYTHESAGVAAVQRMKELSVSGKGLTSFIRTQKPGHSHKRK